MTTLSAVLALVLLMAAPQTPGTIPIEYPPDLEVSAEVEAAVRAAIVRDRTTAVAIRFVHSELWLVALVFGAPNQTAPGRCRGAATMYAPTGDEHSAWQRLPSSWGPEMSYAILASKTIADCSNPKSSSERIALGGEVNDANLNGIVAAIKASQYAKSRIMSIVMKEEILATVTVIGSDGDSVDLQVLQQDAKWTVRSEELAGS